MIITIFVRKPSRFPNLGMQSGDHALLTLLLQTQGMQLICCFTYMNIFGEFTLIQISEIGKGLDTAVTVIKC